jgi:diguanylate cyclase (GGDEF)-like protein
LRDLVRKARQARGLDYLVVQLGSGETAGAFGTANLLPGAPAITSQTILAPGQLSPLLIPAAVPIQGNGPVVARVFGGTFLDQDEAQRLSLIAGTVEMEVVVGGRPVVSTLAKPISLPPPRLSSFTPAKGYRALFTRVGAPDGGRPGGVAVIARLQGDIAGLQNAIMIVLLGSVIVASLLGFGLARAVWEPIRRLANQASAVLAGSPELAASPEVAIAERSGDEVTTVSTTLSAMSEHLHQYATELSESREELRQSLKRLGTTLRSTHDLHGMLSVVLDSAAVSLLAESGAVYLVDPADSHLYAEVSRGLEPTALRMEMGEGIAGTAAREAHTVLWPGAGAPERAPAEPERSTAVAVPLVRGERTIGVVTLYGRSAGSAFSAEDGATLAAFARETAVAVENVLLHEQAERLSMTDALTGTGNRRFLEVTLAREIERARRYGRPMSLLMVDIDRFKQVNDEFGHLTGDEVLAEVARRLEESVRHGIDTVARYGGEEFVVVLPETAEPDARVIAERVRDSMGSEAFPAEEGFGETSAGNGHTVGPGPVRLTVSVGFATFPEDGESSEALVRAADLAMYKAKARGGDDVESARQGSRNG